MKPEDFPLDESIALDPDKIFFIKSSSGHSSDVAIFDVTTKVERNYDDMSDQFVDEVETLAKDVEPSSATLELKRPRFLKRRTIVMDDSKEQVAEINAPVLGFGVRKFSFPQGSSHSSHDIEMKPVSIGSRAEGFVKDSVQYFWDKQDKIATLSKVMGDKRVHIAKFGAKHNYDKGGVLALDTQQIDAVVAMITCVALLQQLDSFAGPLPHAKWAGLTWGMNMV